MIIAKSLSEFNEALGSLANKTDIGFVPTMGALHEGHLSLVRHSVEKCTHTVVSIFVNPTQFNNKQDLASYPRTLEADCKLLEGAGASIVFAPDVTDIYPQEDNRVFDLGGLDSFGEGPRRPGHFNGVAQVVTRLFDIVKPKYAFFGEKDYQQIAIIKYFVRKLGYNITIIPCPIIRENDGLAKSSRNTLLTWEQREAAPDIYKALKWGVERLHNTSSGEKITPQELIKEVTAKINSNKELETEYVEIVDGETLRQVNSWDESRCPRMWCAVYARPVRLIDNIDLTLR